MRLNALDSLASVGPDLDLTIVTTSVAPALLIEAHTGEKTGSIGTAHDTWLLKSLGHIGWMPEDYLLWRDSRESQIVCALRPGNIQNTICGSVRGKKILLPLNVVDAHSMVI